jgi:hypothetical protein
VALLFDFFVSAGVRVLQVKVPTLPVQVSTQFSAWKWAAGAGQVARACAYQWRAGGLVWQGRPGWPGALQHLLHGWQGTGAVETTMHMYLHCPLHHAPRVRLLQAVDAWWQAQASDAFTGEPSLAPSRLEALRWVQHSDSALVEGRLVGASAVRLGASLHLAAYVFHREATKARRVRGAGARGRCGRRRWPGAAAPL